MLASQLGNVNMTAVGEGNSAEGGGLQGTFQNLGSSIGTALIGSIFIASLTTGFVGSINQTSLPTSVKDYVNTNSKAGVEVVSAQQVEDFAKSQDLSQPDVEEVTNTYVEAQVNGLKQAVFGIMALAALSIFLSRNIPAKKLG